MTARSGRVIPVTARVVAPCLVFAAVPAVLAACQIIGDIKERPVAPTVAEPMRACKFPGAAPETVDVGSIRFGNLFPGDGGAHLCIQSVSNPDEPPLMLTRGVGTDCPGSVPYSRVLMPLKVAAGLYDVSVVGEGAPDCSSSALATLPEAVVKREQTTTIVYMSNDAGGAQVRSYLERVEKNQETGVRFVHAAAGVGPVDLAELGPEWPPVGALVLASGIRYGGVPESTVQPGQILGEGGYLILSKLGAGAWFGFSATQDGGTADAGPAAPETPGRYLATGSYQLANGKRLSSFLIGRGGDVDYPIELLRCNDDAVEDDYFTSCSGLGRRDLSFLAFHSGLYGAFAPFHRERFQKMLEVLPTLDADVLCLSHVMADDDKSAMKSALEAGGYEVYFAEQNLETPVDDPTDIHGDRPPLPQTPPCTGPKTLERMGKFLDCLRRQANESGIILNGKAASTYCSTEAAGLLALADEHAKPCFACIAYTIAGFETIDDTEQLCTTNPSAGLGFLGKSGQLLASRLPMGKAETYTLPSTSWRANVYRVPLNVSAVPAVESWIDVYCTSLNSSVRQEPLEPYTGPYGEGYIEKTSENQASYRWANEALLQAHKTRDFMMRTSGGRRAVLLGNFDSGPGNKEAGLERMAPELFEYLGGEFGLGVPRDYPPQCLLCADNPLNAQTVFYTWPEHIFLHGTSPGAVLSTLRVLTEPVVPVPAEEFALPDAGAGDAGHRFEEIDGKQHLLIPLSQHYAIQSTIRIAP